MKSVFRWGWLALAAALVCVPARAEGCPADVESECYSSVDVDSYGNIAGASVTIVPYWYGMFDLEAYVEGLLEGPGVSDDVDGYDDESGYAEADTTGVAGLTGTYSQYGNHWIVDYYDEEEDLEIAETEDDDSYTAPTCTYYPSFETQQEYSPNWTGPMMTGSGPVHQAAPYVSPQDQDFSGWWASESDAGSGSGSDGCWAQVSSGDKALIDPFNVLSPGDPFQIHTGDYGGYINWYIDSNGWYPDPITFYRDARHNVSLPCNNSLYQVMTMYCPLDDTPYIWATNHLVYTIEANKVDVNRADSPPWSESY